MVVLNLDSVSKSFKMPNGVNEVLSCISLTLNKGETIGIRGENGAGKTTLINIIAGIDNNYTGNVSYINNHDGKLHLGVVFQNYNSTLLPWLNVKENICIPLKIQGFKKSYKDKKLSEVIERLKFSSLQLTNYPHQLSGGQKQKVSIARALIQEPDILILDEPFTSLDFQACIDLHDTIQEIQTFKSTAIIVVSHIIDHILYLADKVLLLGGHPSSIMNEFEIDLPRPRTKSVLVSKKFEELRNMILNIEYAAFHNEED